MFTSNTPEPSFQKIDPEIIRLHRAGVSSVEVLVTLNNAKDADFIDIDGIGISERLSIVGIVVGTLKLGDDNLIKALESDSRILAIEIERENVALEELLDD